VLPASEKLIVQEAVRLCQEDELDPDQQERLMQIVLQQPYVFCHADANGLIAMHLLCSSKHVSSLLLQELLDRTPYAAACFDARQILPLHWLSANPVATAEMLLLVLEAFELASVSRDNFGQLPLHWICGSPLQDRRSLQLLVTTNPDAVETSDTKGMLPLHWLCNNPNVNADALATLLDASSYASTVLDHHGQLPLHILCNNIALTADALKLLLKANPEAVSQTDREGSLPIHCLVKCHPEEGGLWQMLMHATGQPVPSEPNEGGCRLSKGEQKGVPVLVSQSGDVKGVKGRVNKLLKNAAETEGSARGCRKEDRGALLFVTSMSAVKSTADACRQAAALLDTLAIQFEIRDVFVNHQYANQLRRLVGIEGKSALPLLPQLYANAKLIGGLDVLRQLNEDSRLVQELHDFRLGIKQMVCERECDECAGHRFVMCAHCHGSRRGRNTGFGQLKCSHCNENGLMPCMLCNADGLQKPEY